MAEAKTADVSITRLRLKIGGENHDVTVDQARKLYEALGGLFGKPAPEIRVEKEYIHWPYWYFSTHNPIYDQPVRQLPSLPFSQPVWVCKENTSAGDATLYMEVL